VAVTAGAESITPLNRSIPFCREGYALRAIAPIAERPAEDAHGGVVSHTQGITNGSVNASMSLRRPVASVKDATTALKDATTRKSTPLLVV